MRGRIYSPSTRQFLTPDPLGRLGASPYSYVRNNPINWIDPSGFTEEDPEGGWYSGFAGLFGSVPVAAIDMSPSLVSHVVASVAAMDFPNGNDAPNSSGIPAGTGAAPMACSMPGEAGCLPSSGPPTPEESYARYTTPVELSLTLPTSRGMTRERSPELEEAEHEYDALLLELTASATADAGLDYVRELRTDPATRDPFAQALWGPFAAKYEAERLRLGVDLLLQGGLGSLGALARGAVAAEAAAPRAYSVAFEARLTARGIGKYGAHFTEANEQLLRAMADPDLAAALRQTLGANFEGSILSRSGSVLGRSPAGWTWHHVVDQPGVLQLVPQAQHAPGSAWQVLLHPGGRGRGGMFVWGSRY
jgi:hypothetical protein